MTGWIDLISKNVLSLGYARELPLQYPKMLLDNQTEEIIKLIKTKCFVNYYTLFNGTASFASAEAIILRLVTKECRIIQVLVRVALFKNHLMEII